MTGLECLLDALQLDTPMPLFPSASVLTKPLDIGRAYLAGIMDSLIEANSCDAYKSIQWPNNVNNGDLSVILPKLKPGTNPADFGIELQKVGSLYS